MFPGTCIIVPSMCQEKTVQIQNGRTEKGKAVVVCDRIPRGRENYIDQLWLWDGEVFQSAKHPSYCIAKIFKSYCTLELTGALSQSKKSMWKLEWGTMFNYHGKGWVWHLLETGNNSKIEIVRYRASKKKDYCFWKVEMVPGAEPLNFDFGPFHKEYTCVIVPAHSPGKTVHLDDGRTENGTKIVLHDRIAFGDRNDMNQLWLWDGETFRSAKDPRKYLYLRSKTSGTHVELDDSLDVLHYKWIVKRTNATGLYVIFNGRYGTHSWVTDDLEGHNYTPIVINNQTRTCFWKIEMVPEGPERCVFGFTPSPL